MEEKPSEKILLEIDCDDAFDYSKGMSTKYSLKDYLAMIHDEVEKIQ